jgi:hypothetical protein
VPQRKYKHWAAAIKHKGVTRHLGYFKDELAAALAYQTADATLRPEGPRAFSSQYLGVNWNRHSKERETRETARRMLTLSHFLSRFVRARRVALVRQDPRGR